MKVWLHHIGETVSKSFGLIQKGLHENHINVQAFDPVAPTVTGVLVCSGSDVSLFLNKCSPVHQLKIIVVLLAEQPPAIEEIAQWTTRGVVEVLLCDDVGKTVAAICARLERWRKIESMLEAPLVRQNLIGDTPRWRDTLKTLVEIAMFSDKFVLLSGESGTGKELAAKLIHSLDTKMKGREMIVVDCTTIVPSLSGSELFGHTEDAFTGARKARKGAFELANNSTLFLDEIGELPLDLQAALLRVIQEKSFKRVGGNNWQQTEFRLIAATNRDLKKEIQAGRFREDLYHRISAWHCTMPPLRERIADIIPLTKHFLCIHGSDNGPRLIDPIVCELLKTKKYPGNVRELQNLVIRLLGRHAGSGPVTIGDMAMEDWPLMGTVRRAVRDQKMVEALKEYVDDGMGFTDINDKTSDIVLDIALQKCDSNVRNAAEMLQVCARTIQQRLKKRREQSA